MEGNHWGEISKSPVSDFFMPDVTEDIERSMDKFCLSKYSDDNEALKTENLILPSMDPLMLYSISLHKYANSVIEKIGMLESTEKNVKPTDDILIPMHVMPEINVKHTKNNLNFMPKDFRSSAEELEVPELSEAVVKKIISKCVVTMLAHVGFQTTHQSVLDVLTDVLESFFHKICHQFVTAIDDEEKGISTGFPHVVERVLTEAGMGGVNGLNDYYQNRVVKYATVLQNRCKTLNDKYSSLLAPKGNSSVDKLNKLRVKVEDNEEVMDIHNSEVHFTSFDGEPSILETGYQLLNSLEAEENLQSLGDTTEEDGSSASPGVVSMPSEAKKKRFK